MIHFWSRLQIDNLLNELCYVKLCMHISEERVRGLGTNEGSVPPISGSSVSVFFLENRTPNGKGVVNLQIRKVSMFLKFSVKAEIEHRLNFDYNFIIFLSFVKWLLIAFSLFFLFFARSYLILFSFSFSCSLLFNIFSDMFWNEFPVAMC